MTQSSERSVRAGRDMVNSQVISGDHNFAKLTIVKLPDPASVDIAAALAELRAVLAEIGGPDAAKVGRALDDADEEAGKAEPDKAEVAGILARGLDYAKKAADFSEHAGKIGSLVARVAAWVGAGAASAPLLAAIGLAAG